MAEKIDRFPKIYGSGMKGYIDAARAMVAAERESVAVITNGK